jgi:hypothetical protein
LQKGKVARKDSSYYHYCTDAAATAVLPPHTITVAMKTTAATAMAGEQTAINNQLKAATATATMQRQWRRQRWWQGKRSGSKGAVASLTATAAAW